MNHHCHAGSGRSLDLRKWEEPEPVSSVSNLIPPRPTCSVPPSPQSLIPVSQLYHLTPETACPCPHIQCSVSAGLQPKTASLCACSYVARGEPPQGCWGICQGCRVGSGAGLLGADLALGRDFPATLWPPVRKKLALEAGWGKMVLICRGPTTTHLESLNIGTLFWASTESSVAPRLKNKN